MKRGLFRVGVITLIRLLLVLGVGVPFGALITALNGFSAIPKPVAALMVRQGCEDGKGKKCRTATPRPTQPSTPIPSVTRTLTAVPSQSATVTPMSTTATATWTSTPTQVPTSATSEPIPPVSPPSVQQYLPLLMARYSCRERIPDCYEPNNMLITAYEVTAPGLYVAMADKALDRYDFYALSLTVGEAYTFTVTFSQADLDVYLYAEGANPVQLASSNFAGQGMTEQIRFTPASSGHYAVLVYCFDSATPVTYQLEIAAS